MLIRHCLIGLFLSLMVFAFAGKAYSATAVDTILEAHKLARGGKHAEAIERYRLALNKPGLDTIRQFSVYQEIASCLSILRRYDEAVVVLDEAISRLTTLDASRKSSLATRRAQALEMGHKRQQGIEGLEQFVQSGVVAGGHRRKVVRTLAAMHAREGNVAQSLGWYGEILEAQSGDAEAIEGISKLLAQVRQHPRMKDVDAYVNLLRRAVAVNAANPANENTANGAQLALVLLLNGQHDYQRSLAEARLLADVVQDEHMDLALDQLAVAVRGADGSIARVNAYVAYHKHGRAGADGKLETKDDLTDPFGTMTMPDKEARDKVFSEQMAKLRADWEGRLARARVLRYWGRSLEALKELKLAFVSSPMEQEPLQRVTNAIVALLTQLSGDPQAGKRFVAFQKLGPAGSDGKFGTGDDLTNPLDEYLADK